MSGVAEILSQDGITVDVAKRFHHLRLVNLLLHFAISVPRLACIPGKDVAVQRRYLFANEYDAMGQQPDGKPAAHGHDHPHDRDEDQAHEH